jgi:hypothetical protein
MITGGGKIAVFVLAAAIAEEEVKESPCCCVRSTAAPHEL